MNSIRDPWAAVSGSLLGCKAEAPSAYAPSRVPPSFWKRGAVEPIPTPCKWEGSYISNLLLTVLFGKQANLHLPLLLAPLCCSASLGDDRHHTVKRTEGTTLI